MRRREITDHRAVVPTGSAANADLAGLPLGEQETLRLVALGLLWSVCPPHRYAETALAVECGGHSFTAKGKSVLDMGWKAYAEPIKDAALPDGLAEGRTLAVDAVQVKEGQTSPPKHFTENTIPASMENAGAEGHRPPCHPRRYSGKAGGNLSAASGTAVLFPSDKEDAGPCPRCGGAVAESKKGLFCDNRECRFVLWKDSRFFTAKRKALTKSIAAALLNKSCICANRTLLSRYIMWYTVHKG